MIMATTPMNLADVESYSDERPAAQSVLDHPELGAKLIGFEPGQSLAPHHTEADAFFLVIKGQGSIAIGDEEHSVVEGDVIPAPAKIDHGITNSGTERLSLLLVQSPNPFFCC